MVSIHRNQKHETRIALAMHRSRREYSVKVELRAQTSDGALVNTVANIPISWSNIRFSRRALFHSVIYFLMVRMDWGDKGVSVWTILKLILEI
jgi:hypothetical protein